MLLGLEIVCAGHVMVATHMHTPVQAFDVFDACARLHAIHHTKSFCFAWWGSGMCRLAEEFMLLKGGSIGYWAGHIPQVLDDIVALRPTLFCGVPRVFDRIYAGIYEQVCA